MKLFLIICLLLNVSPSLAHAGNANKKDPAEQHETVLVVTSSVIGSMALARVANSFESKARLKGQITASEHAKMIDAVVAKYMKTNGRDAVARKTLGAAARDLSDPVAPLKDMEGTKIEFEMFMRRTLNRTFGVVATAAWIYEAWDLYQQQSEVAATDCKSTQACKVLTAQAKIAKTSTRQSLKRIQ